MPKLFSYLSVSGRIGWLAVGLVALLGLGCESSLTSPMSALGTGGAAGDGPQNMSLDAGGADSGLCRDYFYLTIGADGGTSPTYFPCCPVPAPDCSDKPDQYPGYICTPRDAPYCSCNCQQHVWSCGC
jgi:hypothetical protein